MKRPGPDMKPDHVPFSCSCVTRAGRGPGVLAARLVRSAWGVAGPGESPTEEKGAGHPATVCAMRLPLRARPMGQAGGCAMEPGVSASALRPAEKVACPFGTCMRTVLFRGTGIMPVRCRDILTLRRRPSGRSGCPSNVWPRRPCHVFIQVLMCLMCLCVRRLVRSTQMIADLFLTYAQKAGQ